MTAPHTFALCIFMLIAILGIVMVIQSFFKPFAAFGLFKMASGFDFSELKDRDNETSNAFKTLLSFQASALLGGNSMTLFLSWMAFHDSVALAWWALWYWPIMFFWHFIIYKKATPLWYVQIVWIFLSVTALLLTRNIAFP
ncbi:MAG: hypothetical protein IPJ06_11605 [Saprospiraceae bacterium]|nr:hypothetical protein [Saprospiraceae bacterium]